MADQLCYVDAYAREVETTVVSVEPGVDDSPALVGLGATVFYPGGGGQPTDRGWLRAADGRVWDVRSAAGTHVANTREVGGIRVTGYESKGRINKRIRIELVDDPPA